MTRPITDPLFIDPPEPLMQRPLYAHEATVNTYRLMNDGFRQSNDKWNDASAGSVHSGNVVKYLVNGLEAFSAMADALKTATNGGHFIYLLNWYADINLVISGQDRVSDLLSRAASAGVQVRAMFYRNILGGDNQKLWIIASGPNQLLQRSPVRLVVTTLKAAPPALNEYEWILRSVEIDGQVARALFDGVTRYPSLWRSEKFASNFPYLRTYNDTAVNFVNGLQSPTGAGHCAAIHDHHHPFAASHHQKILIVSGNNGLVGFCGGVDLNEDRKSGLYDVHCEIRGQAAFSLLGIFNERWGDHPDRTKVEQGKPHLGNGCARPAPILEDGQVQVQIARTYGRQGANQTFHVIPKNEQDLVEYLRLADPFPGFSFAPNGVRQVWAMVKKGITTARRFIYLENQYFVSEQLAQEIAKALPNVRHVIILLHRAPDLDTDRGYFRTKKCIDILRRADPNKEKVLVYCKKENVPNDYVHSKTYVFDDEYAIIGSANGSRRSFSCDSEVAAGVYDESQDDHPAWRFAHRLRVRLWAGLLNMDSPRGHSELADPLAAVAHWLVPPAGSVVEEFEANVQRPAEDPSPGWKWDNIFDPFPGSF